MRLRLLILPVSVFGLLYACSASKIKDPIPFDDPEVDAEPTDDTDGEGGAGGEEDDAGTVGGKGGSAGRKDSGPDSSGGSKADARHDAKDAVVSEPDSQVGISCDSPVDCETAESVGDVAGDASSAQIEYQGATEQWLQVRVKETDSGWTGHRMHIRITLDSPPGENFDIRAFLDRNNDTVSCDILADQSKMGADQQDVLDLSWGETGTGNDDDDSRTISLQVFLGFDHPGVCSTDGQWTLQVNSVSQS